MPDVQIALDDAMLVECSRCSAVSVVRAAHDVTNELAAIAAFTGGLLTREVTCPECGAPIEVPCGDGGGGDA